MHGAYFNKTVCKYKKKINPLYQWHLSWGQWHSFWFLLRCWATAQHFSARYEAVKKKKIHPYLSLVVSEIFSFWRSVLPDEIMGFPGSSVSKESACNAGDMGSIPRSGRSPGEGNGKATPVFLPGEFHGQRTLVGYSPRSHKESDMNWMTNTDEINPLRIKSPKKEAGEEEQESGSHSKDGAEGAWSYCDSPGGARRHSIQSGRAGSAPPPCGTGTWGTSRCPCRRLPGPLCRCCGDTGKADMCPPPLRDCQRSLRHTRHIWSLLSNKTSTGPLACWLQDLVPRHCCQPESPPRWCLDPQGASYWAKAGHAFRERAASRERQQVLCSGGASALVLCGHGRGGTVRRVPTHGLSSSLHRDAQSGAKWCFHSKKLSLTLNLNPRIIFIEKLWLLPEQPEKWGPLWRPISLLKRFRRVNKFLLYSTGNYIQ